MAASLAGSGLSAQQRHAVRALELDAYKKVVRCFMQGPYDLAKEEALATLRQVLHITNDDHLRLRQDVRAEQQRARHGPGQQAAEASQQQQQQGQGVRALASSELLGETASPPSISFALSSHPSPFQNHQALAAASAKAGSRAASASRGAAGAAAKPRKRLKGENGSLAGGGGGGGRPPSRQPAAAGAAAGLDIDPLVGRKVLRYWPKDGGWFEGIVSDFNAATGEHCIVYDFGLPTESYEWYNMEGASPSEFRLLQGNVDVSLLPGMQQQQQGRPRAPAPAGAAGAAAQPPRQPQQRAAPAAAAPVRQRSSVTAAGWAGVALAGSAQARAPGVGQQRGPVAVTRPRLAPDWSSEEEDDGEEEGAGGSDQEWGPGKAMYSDASD